MQIKLHSCLFFLILLSLRITTVKAQVAISKNDSISFNLYGIVNKIQRLRSNGVKLPEDILLSRNSLSPIQSNLTRETDNPLIHGAVSLGLSMNYKYKNSTNLFLDLVSEHRGISYGVFNTKNTIIYPLIYATLLDTIELCKSKFVVDIQIGNLSKNYLNDKILFYNVNKNGLHADFLYKKAGVSFVYYPDYSRGIGLNVDEYASLMPNFHLSKHLSTSFGLLYMKKSRSAAINNSPWLLKTAMNLDSEKYSLYAQGILRLTGDKYSYNGIEQMSSIINKFAFVIGANTNLNCGIISSNNSIDFRFYGKVFNIDHIDRLVSYRDTSLNTLFANTIGDNLYPLEYYNSGFNQWAISTEYENKDVVNLNIVSNNSLQLNTKNYLNFNIDITWIKSSGRPSFLYNFYEFSYRYEYSHNVDALIFITNKGMNLDMHYPTFYMYEDPYIGVRIIKNK